MILWIETFALREFFHLQVTALSNVEAKKRFEFLEAVSGTMDAHLRYFKQVWIERQVFCPFHMLSH